MKIEILPEAQADLDDGYWFYENQAAGLGEYFLTSIVSDIRSLQYSQEFTLYFVTNIECSPVDFLIRYFIELRIKSFLCMQ